MTTDQDAAVAAGYNWEVAPTIAIARAALTPTEEPGTCPTCGSKKRKKRRELKAPYPFETARCPDPWHGEEPDE